MGILEGIFCHDDLIGLDPDARQTLCREIREFLIEHVSKTGGHIASNLGIVELTVAIETVFDTRKDRLVFDVGHQSYVHKILTGRAEAFDSLRQADGISGFPSPSESDTDAFTAGHASSSVSVALGMARARTLQGDDYQVIALLGDGAVTGGMAYEGLNDAAVSNEPMIIILNDNEMSIDRNVGGMASHLKHLRSKARYLGMKSRYKQRLLNIPGGRLIYRAMKRTKDVLRRMLIPTTVFETMGFTYVGPVDGHDTEQLIALLRIAKDMKRPVILHVATKKGKGYPPAETNPMQFHGICRFNPRTGVPEKCGCVGFSGVFGETMLALAEQESRLCAITAAMPGGTGLLGFEGKYPMRFFDVGIAEQHAVSMAGGLAKQGMIPVVAIYSTFLQRAYDQIMQDVCMQSLHVVFAIDRAGLVGEDGQTHQGIFDVGYLRQCPNMTVLAPACPGELQKMLRWAVLCAQSPVAIRYPRCVDHAIISDAWSNEKMSEGKGLLTCCTDGEDVTLITYGTLIKNVTDAAELLENKGIHAKVLRLLSLKPLPIDAIVSQIHPHQTVVVIEEVNADSGICGALAAELTLRLPNCRVYGRDLKDQFVQHGSADALRQKYGLDSASVADFVWEVCSGEE